MIVNMRAATIICVNAYKSPTVCVQLRRDSLTELTQKNDSGQRLSTGHGANAPEAAARSQREFKWIKRSRI